LKKILLDISFLGTAYCGYQIQPNTPTIQQQLNFATKSLFGFDCDITGCSRTDSGVHANHFFATISKKGEPGIDTTINIDKIPQALCFYLPNDISVNNAAYVDQNFHARYDVKSKEYVYLIWNKRERNPFFHERCWHYPKEISLADIERMNEAAKYFVGTQDFVSYMAEGSKVTNTVRTVYSATVEKKENIVCFRISADGFLYNMVRIMMGTLIEVAQGKKDPADICDITKAKNRMRAGITAPPQGLYLNRVIY